MRYDVTKGGKL